MKAESVHSEISFHRMHEVIDIRYSFGHLAVTVSGEPAGECVVTFEEVAGLRVLDEGDLLEFWPECSSQRGWLFRVLEGGWFSQESERSGFLAQHTKKVTEYLINGANDCVSILAWSEPKVTPISQQDMSIEH